MVTVVMVVKERAGRAERRGDEGNRGEGDEVRSDDEKRMR